MPGRAVIYTDLRIPINSSPLSLNLDKRIYVCLRISRVAVSTLLARGARRSNIRHSRFRVQLKSGQFPFRATKLKKLREAFVPTATRPHSWDDKNQFSSALRYNILHKYVTSLAICVFVSREEETMLKTRNPTD